ncbi:MAG: hypothetical protein ACRD0F_09830, partial [Acidimicrobiales bacterium]
AEVAQEVEAHVAAVNAGLGRFEQVRRWAVVGDEWRPDSDVLTPTMKLKRRAVEDRYAATIDAMYPAP